MPNWGPDFAGASSVHINIFGLNPVAVHGSDEQKRAWLPRIIRGEDRACFGVTEANAGLDTARIQTRAVRQGDVYVVNGAKIWTSTAQTANKILLLARTAPLETTPNPIDGLTLFYTDLDRSCCKVTEIEKMGRRAVDLSMVFIDGLRVPVSHRIGVEGKGFRYLLEGFNPSEFSLPPRRSGSVAPRCDAPPNMPRSVMSSAARSARTRRSSIPWRAVGRNWKRPIS